MIQDIDEKFDNAYKNILPASDDTVICIKGSTVLLCNAGGNISYPTYLQVGGDVRYAFSIGGTNYFLGTADEFGNFRYEHFAVLRTAQPRKQAFAGTTALHLSRWYADNVYCSRCGEKLYHSDDERALKCSCGNIVYPRINPAVIVAIISNGKLCMTKYNRANAHWALVAGFCEIGETVEQTVHREVMEETGLRVKNLKYYKSQPWGFTSTMLYGFYCEVDGDDKIVLDCDELKAGKWFAPNEIEFADDGLSLTREMIDNFKNNYNH